MNTEYKGIKISEDTKFENMDFVQYDFSMSDLSEVVFENVNFSNCTFNKTVCKKTRFWGCFFEDCIFSRVDLSDTYIGVPKVQVNGIDFSSATMQFLDFSECELQHIIPPTDDKHLLIDKDLYEITKCVSDEIKNSWYRAVEPLVRHLYSLIIYRNTLCFLCYSHISSFFQVTNCTYFQLLQLAPFALIGTVLDILYCL